MGTKVETAYGCTVEVKPSDIGLEGVWLFSRTAMEVNKAILLTPEAMKQLRKLLK